MFINKAVFQIFAFALSGSALRINQISDLSNSKVSLTKMLHSHGDHLSKFKVSGTNAPHSVSITARPDIDFIMWDVGDNVDGSIYHMLMTDQGERFVQNSFHKALNQRCKANSSADDAWKNGVVLDIGANAGFYGLLGLAYGCAAVFFEPQPGCINLIKKSLESSKFDEGKYRIIPHALGNAQDASKGITLDVNPERCNGRFPIENLEKGDVNAYGHAQNSIKRDGLLPVSILDAAETIESLSLGSAPKLMKLDTEGNELRILESLAPHLKKWNVHNLVVEITPMWWKHLGYTSQSGADILASISSQGFTVSPQSQTTDLHNARETHNYIAHHDLKASTWNGPYQENIWFHLDERN